MGERRGAYTGILFKTEAKEQLENVGVEERIILKLILNWMGWSGLDLSGS
jgi:hypothetical protein